MNGDVKILFPMKTQKTTSNVLSGGSNKNTDSPVNAELKALQEKCYNELLESCTFVIIVHQYHYLIIMY